MRVLLARCARRGAASALPAIASASTITLSSSARSAAPLQLLAARHFAKKAKGGKQPAASAAPAAAASGSDGADAAQALEQTRKGMTGAVLNFTRQLNQMRPGKADAGAFDDLSVQAYGQHVALSQLAQVAVSGSHSLSVMVYDPSVRYVQCCCCCCCCW